MVGEFEARRLIGQKGTSELLGPGACLEHDGKVVEALTSEPRPEVNSVATSSEPRQCVSRLKPTDGEVASDA